MIYLETLDVDFFIVTYVDMSGNIFKQIYNMVSHLYNFVHYNILMSFAINS